MRGWGLERARSAVASIAIGLVLLMTAPAARATHDTTSRCTVASEDALISFDAMGASSAAAKVNGTAIEVSSGGSTTSCPAATTSTINEIRVTGTSANEVFTIDLTGGPFAPGTPDEGASSEIEFIINLAGGGDGLNIVDGALDSSIAMGHVNSPVLDIANLNAAEQTPDIDLTVIGLEFVTVTAGGGNDTVSAAGAGGMPIPLPAAVTMAGGPGGDSLTAGGSNENFINGEDGPDVINGGASPDQLSGGPGNDELEGQAGIDDLEGGSGEDQLRGGDGRDELKGGEGGDAIDGGPNPPDEADILDYSGASSGVQVNLATGTGSGGEAQGDTIEAIETVFGSIGRDVLTSAAGSTLFGGPGSDVIRSGGQQSELHGNEAGDLIVAGPGSQLLDGGPGPDTGSFPGSQRVALDLTVGLANQAGFVDELISVENASGSSANDSIRGTGGTNRLSGGGGKDVLIALGGRDRLAGQGGRDRLKAGPGIDRCNGGPGRDRGNGCEVSLNIP